MKPDWDKAYTKSKVGFDTVWAWADKLGAPVNKLTNKIGSEAFWPTTLDKEADKAARILQSFCKDGFYAPDEQATMTEEARNIAKYSKQRVIKKIPESVIRKAKGLAIFTTMRTGLWVSGAGGSGVILARMENGEWSPPSGILIHTAGLGFVFGADIYDCVVVINSDKAMEGFKALRCTLGGELSAVAGPVGIGGVIDTEVHARQTPVLTYMKSRGFYAGLGANGSIFVERTDENERFYRERISAADILRGKAREVPKYDLKMLMATLRAAQGDTDVDQAALPDSRPSPGDLEYERMGEHYEAFGLPTTDDPDPFGVHALEEEGFEIREAGTGIKPTSDVFEYKPATTSPAYAVLKRKSLGPEAMSAESSRGSSRARASKMSNPWVVPYADGSTQTIGDEAREEEMAQEALNPVPSVSVRAPPPLPMRGPPPSLPPRTPSRTQLTPSTPVIEEVSASDESDGSEAGYQALSHDDDTLELVHGPEDGYEALQHEEAAEKFQQLQHEDDVTEVEYKLHVEDTDPAADHVAPLKLVGDAEAGQSEAFEDVDINDRADHSSVTTPTEYTDAVAHTHV